MSAKSVGGARGKAVPKRSGGKPSRTAKPKRSMTNATSSSTLSDELLYLRQRVAALDALAAENIALTERIAVLEHELAEATVLLKHQELAQTAAPQAPTPPAPGVEQLTVPALTPEVQANTPPPGRSLEVALERRRSQADDRPSIMLVGDRALFGGGGPSFVHTEIRDLVLAIPKEFAVSFLARQPDLSGCQEVRQSNLRDDVEIIDAVLPGDAEELSALLAALAPDIVMNVGPVDEVAGVIGRIPGGCKAVLNLLHGEVAGFRSATDLRRFTGAAAALVTTAGERDRLVALGFAGEILIYLRGGNVQKLPLVGLDGGAAVVCIAEDAASESLSLVRKVAVQLRAEGIEILVMGTRAGVTDLDLADRLQPESEMELLQAIETASAILVPPETRWFLPALQAAQVMGKVCLLPEDPFGSPEWSHLPGLRYPADGDGLSKAVRAFVAHREAHGELANRTAAYARKTLRRSEWAKVLRQFLWTQVGDLAEASPRT